jgi:hypothetical protein
LTSSCVRRRSAACFSSLFISELLALRPWSLISDDSCERRSLFSVLSLDKVSLFFFTSNCPHATAHSFRHVGSTSQNCATHACVGQLTESRARLGSRAHCKQMRGLNSNALHTKFELARGRRRERVLVTALCECFRPGCVQKGFSARFPATENASAAPGTHHLRRRAPATSPGEGGNKRRRLVLRCALTRLARGWTRKVPSGIHHSRSSL